MARHSNATLEPGARRRARSNGWPGILEEFCLLDPFSRLERVDPDRESAFSASVSAGSDPLIEPSPDRLLHAR